MKFLQNNYVVINLDIKINSTFDKMNNYKHYQLDLTNFELLQQTLNEVQQNYQISTIIANAGKHLAANIEETTIEQFHDLMRLNCEVNFYILKSLLPSLKKHGGTIVFIGSDQTVIVKPNSSAYIASKRAAEGLILSLVADYAKDNIRVISLASGTVDTPLYQNAIKNYADKSNTPLAEIKSNEAKCQPIGRIGNATEIAEMAFFVTQTSKIGYLTGARIAIDGGYTII
jgi:NAD(P)-dependent dehydrogenase (short-subunit alcohol dehydrogenase family)